MMEVTLLGCLRLCFTMIPITSLMGRRSLPFGREALLQHQQQQQQQQDHKNVLL